MMDVELQNPNNTGEEGKTTKQLIKKPRKQNEAKVPKEEIKKESKKITKAITKTQAAQGKFYFTSQKRI